MQKGIQRKRPPAKLSEYGRQLKEKQTLKREYNLRERQFKRYMKEIPQKKQREGKSAEFLIQRLERRLDNVILRMGMAQTRKQARQMVSHGHFLINGKPLGIPSYQMKTGDVASLHPSSFKSILFQNIQLSLKKYQPPSWIELDKVKMEAKITGLPAIQDVLPSVELPLVFEFYSR